MKIKFNEEISISHDGQGDVQIDANFDGDTLGFTTPEQARKLAAELLVAADAAEGWRERNPSKSWVEPSPRGAA